MAEIDQEIKNATCCLCLSEDESNFTTNSIMKSLPLHEMINFCIGLQVNGENEIDRSFSTSICNECVLNINNFYTFKKKILEAQELISSFGIKNGTNNQASTMYVEEDMSHIIDLSEEGGEETHLLEIENESAEEVGKIDSYVEHKSPEKETVQITRLIRVENVKKPTNGSSSRRPVNKRTKIDNIEKVIIQMNECLICPAILGDILELKDHIEAHTDIKCKACKRQFARYSNLKRHFNGVHSKPKPFQCDLCGLGFNFSVNLQAHAALHYSGKLRKESTS